MWFSVIHILLLTRTCALFDHLVIINFRAVWTLSPGSVDLMRNKTQAMELLGPFVLEELFFLDVIGPLVSIHPSKKTLDFPWLPIAWWPKLKKTARNRTVFSPRRSLRDVNGHLDSSHSSLMDKQTRTLAERWVLTSRCSMCPCVLSTWHVGWHGDRHCQSSNIVLLPWKKAGFSSSCRWKMTN